MKGRGFQTELDFGPSPTVWEFFGADNFVTGIMGPLGSGKSVGCCAKIMRKALQQKPGRNNLRRTRWAVIRNTYDELKRTTIKTWLELFPEAHCGPIVYSHPITHRINVPAINGEPGIEMEVVFLALDKPQDVRKLKSWDVTGVWINECCEVPRDIFEMATGRVGRFPPRGEEMATWAGVFLDTNASDDQNWYYDIAEKGSPLPMDLDPALFEGMEIDLSWQFWKQPTAILEVTPIQGGAYRVCEPGYVDNLIPANRVIPAAGRFWTINEGAENLPFLRPAYYVQQIANKDIAWIQRFLQAKYVYWVPGKPWVPEFSDFAMARDLIYQPELPLIGGIDAGSGTLSPAATVGQRGMFGDWRVLAELSVFDMGIDRFSTALKMLLQERFAMAPKPPVFYCDPATKTKDEVYEIQVMEHLISNGLQCMLSPTNKPSSIREAYANVCTRAFNVHGQLIPGFLVDKSCTMLRAGLAGKWHRRRMATTSERYQDQPEKTDESHVCDAGGYMLVGGGEYKTLTRGTKPEVTAAAHAAASARRFSAGQTVQAKTEFNPLS